MTTCLLLLALFPQQLTWYEYYERGERSFARGQYDRCIDDMTAAIAIKPDSKRNQFTHSIQKIDYKPYYYLALAHYRLKDLPKAYEYVQRAYKGEVVRDQPLLQNDLAVVLDAWYSRISDLHNTYKNEQQLIDTRTELLKLLNQGRLAEAARRLDNVSDPSKFEDIKLQLNMRQELQNKSNDVYDSIKTRIERLIDNGSIQAAQDLYDGVRATLPSSYRERLDQTFARAPRPAPAEPKRSAEPAPTSPALSHAALAEAERFKRQLADLENVADGLRTELADMTQTNAGLEKRLAERKDATPNYKPQPLIVLEESSGRLHVSATVTAAAPLEHWTLSLNQVEVPIPAIGTPEAGVYAMSTMIDIAQFGRQQVVFSVTDSLGLDASVSHEIVIARPWYLYYQIYVVLVAMALALLALRFWLAHRRRRRALMRHFNPYIAGSPVRNQVMFYGRDELMHRIQNLVHKNSFMIFGARRIGKTSLLLQLKKNLAELKSDDYKFFPCFIDLQGVREDDLFHHMMDEVHTHRDDWGLSELSLAYDEDDQRDYQARQFSKDLKQIIVSLQALHPQCHIQLVLLMDEVDVLNEFTEKTNQKLRGIFMKDFAEHLSCVMAGIHLKKEWDSAGSPWYNFFEQIPVEPFAEEAARALVLDPVKGIFSYEPEAVNLIVEGTSRHPYLIQKVCVALIGTKLQAGSFRVTAAEARQALDKLNEEIQRNKHELYHQQVG